MKKTSTLFLFILILSSVLFSQVKPGKYHPFAGRLIITNGGSVNLGMNDYSQLEPAFGYNLSATYHIPSKNKGIWGVRFSGEYGITKNSDNDLALHSVKNKFFYFGGSVNYSRYYGNHYLPYISLGAGYTIFDPQDGDGNKTPENKADKYEKSNLTFSGELGMDIMLDKKWSLNLNLRAKYASEDYLDNLAKGSHKDMIVSAGVGVSFALFSPEVSLEKKRKPRDSDKDGVIDRLDLCRNTPPGVIVDKNGCPIDSDKDGVPDYQDICPQTPEGVEVDSDGCPIDSDGDGVADYIDKCPDTKEGVEVDEDGCPIEQATPKEETEKEYNFETETKINSFIYTDNNMFCLQTSAFKKKKNAEREAARLVKENHKAFVHEAEVPSKGGKWFQVRVGFFDSQEDADTYRKKYFVGKKTRRRNSTYLEIKK